MFLLLFLMSLVCQDFTANEHSTQVYIQETELNRILNGKNIYKHRYILIR
jgi:hypothetical protein